MSLDVQTHDDPAHHTLLYRKIVLPLLALLRMGATPEKLAWSLAIGIVIGINPLFGSTTILSLGVILALRLNTVAGQLANHSMYPLQLALLLPFIKLGERIFHTGPLPIGIKQILPMAKLAPFATVKLLWIWEWHAMVAWALAAVVLTPVLALILTPVLRYALTYRAKRAAQL